MIDPRHVVQEARPKASPLHALFEWDDTRAAEKWRIHRARIIIGSVTVRVTTQQFTVEAPAYIVDPTVRGPSRYRSMVAMKTEKEHAREALIFTLETAAGHIRRGLLLAGPLGLSSEVDRLLAQIAGVQRLVRSQRPAPAVTAGREQPTSLAT